MYIRFKNYTPRSISTFCPGLFTLCFAGIIFSYFIDHRIVRNCSSLMLAACNQRMSIVSLLILFLPFVLISIWISQRKPIFIYLYFFARFILIGIVIQSVRYAFPTGDWIVYGLLIFPGLCIIFLSLLYFLMQMNISVRSRKNKLIILFLSIAIWMLDYWFISPFAVYLFQE